MFYIEIKDTRAPKSPIYTLDAFIDIDNGYTNVYIGNTHNGTRMDTCVRFLVEEGDPGVLLEDFNTRQSCDMNHSLPEGSGTRCMLMGALKFLMEKYTYVKYVNLSDVAQKKGTRVYLTPKRLLLGQPGWYEANFGAKPSSNTRKIHHEVFKEISLTPEDKVMIANQSWGTNKDIVSLHPMAKKLIHSDWVISRKTIQAYPVKIRVLEKLTGGSRGKNTDAFIKHMERANIRFINDQFKAAQLKYKRD